MSRSSKKPTPSFVVLHEDNVRLANLCGPLDENLRQIEAAFEVRVARRGARFTVEGARSDAAAEAIRVLHYRADHPLTLADVQLSLIELGAGPVSSAAGGAATSAALAASPDQNTVDATGTPQDADAAVLGHSGGADSGSRGIGAASHKRDAALAPEPVGSADIVLRTRRADLRGRTPRQRQYLQQILAHDITFGVGPAGTGKTYLAVACAVDALERDAVQRLVLTRPAVEAGERLGFLPGDLTQKVDPYLRPLYDALYDLLGFDKVQRLFERQTIEIAPLAYMRGRTLNNAFIILDEAQNTTPEQMKMFLTRIGFGSRAVITGDPTQVDLQRGQRSGLMDACQVLEPVQGVAFTQFTSADVVRHPLVARIVEAYERAQISKPS